jgi:hypothetical protein
MRSGRFAFALAMNVVDEAEVEKGVSGLNRLHSTLIGSKVSDPDPSIDGIDEERQGQCNAKELSECRCGRISPSCPFAVISFAVAVARRDRDPRSSGCPFAAKRSAVSLQMPLAAPVTWRLFRRSETITGFLFNLP